jgi:hypothetical protein
MKERVKAERASEKKAHHNEKGHTKEHLRLLR